MPTRPPSLCTYPGCSAVVAAGVGRCPAHRVERWRVADAVRRSNPELESVARFRSSRAWRNLRDVLVAQHPLCCLCGGLTAQIHHVVPLVESPERGLDVGNLAPLCAPCHRRVEAQIQRGIETADLFPPERRCVFRAGIG